MSARPSAPATERNRQPILDVLRQEFRDVKSVLEIGSGTGQHAVFFATRLTHLTWQTSDLQENHAGILSWLSDAALPNVHDPFVLDVMKSPWPSQIYDGVFSANTAHIMSFAAVKKMFELVDSVLSDGGVFLLYGPFRQGGEFNTQSNADFHASLRRRDAQMGIRHLEDLDSLGETGGMRRVRLYALPANNHIAVWVKEGTRNER